MLQRKTMLAEMQEEFSGYEFKKIVNQYNGDKWTHSFSTKSLLTILLYYHLSGKNSIRDIVLSLKSRNNLWYHFGLKSVSRNNLSYAMQHRDAEIFRQTFFLLLNKYVNEKGIGMDKRFRFKNPLKAIDSTTISLCLNIFDWAKYRKSKGGVKLHTSYDIKNQIPEFVDFSNAIRHDITKWKAYPIIADAIYAMDKGYIYFKFLQKINKNKAFFVTRTKINTKYRIIKRQTKKHNSIKADWIVKLTGVDASEYPQELRVVRYFDKEKKMTYEYLTNNFKLSAKTIADIYKARWDIELFFKELKQNLKIKTFLGTSENALKIQIWVALIAYLLIQYIRFKTKTGYSFLNSFRLIRENILIKISYWELLLNDFKKKPKPKINYHQLEFGF